MSEHVLHHRRRSLKLTISTEAHWGLISILPQMKIPSTVCLKVNKLTSERGLIHSIILIHATCLYVSLWCSLGLYGVTSVSLLIINQGNMFDIWSRCFKIGQQHPRPWFSLFAICSWGVCNERCSPWTWSVRLWNVIEFYFRVHVLQHRSVFQLYRDMWGGLFHPERNKQKELGGKGVFKPCFMKCLAEIRPYTRAKAVHKKEKISFLLRNTHFFLLL